MIRLQIEPETIGRWIIERKARLRVRRDDPGAVDARTIHRLEQAELDRVPVEPGEVVKMVEVEGPLSTLAISFHIVGEYRVGEHRHVAEHVVKDVRLLQVVQPVRGRG